MKFISTLVVVAAIGLTIPGAVFAQQTVGKNGFVVDGNGGAGKVANMFLPDGPGETFQSLNETRVHRKWLIDTYAAECRARLIDPAWCRAQGYATDR